MASAHLEEVDDTSDKSHIVELHVRDKVAGCLYEKGRFEAASWYEICCASGDGDDEDDEGKSTALLRSLRTYFGEYILFLQTFVITEC